MAYATFEDLKRRLSDTLGELYRKADFSEAADEASADLEAASAEIDGAAGVRYAVPVGSPAAAPLLRDWCLTLAEELAWARTGRGVPDWVKDRCALVRRRLEELAKGGFTLAGAALQEAADGSGVAVVECDRPVFGRGRMEGF